MHISNIIKYLLLCQLLTGCYSKQENQDLIDYTNKINIKGDKKVVDAIVFAARAYNLNPEKLARIAMIESGMNPKARNTNNKNHSIDIGLFQINSVNWSADCKGIDIESIEGNSICAAKLVAQHREHAATDPFWIGRYHSKTPSLKKKYYNKYEKLGSK